MKGHRLKIACIGSGITGLSAAWLLSQRHDVTLFERNTRIGGHSNTVAVDEGNATCPVDTGFIVYNIASYPNLIALFAHLDVPTAATEMSFSVSIDNGAYEYSGNGLAGLFGQPANVLRPSHWRMTRDILRFFRDVSALDPDTIDPDVSLGSWLAEHAYSDSFITGHILPMGAAIWSTPAADMMAFPFAAFARFFANHGLLQVDNRPEWRTVVGGSRVYVDKILSTLSGPVIKGDGVKRIERDSGKPTLVLQSGHTETFDACLVCTHADEALGLLSEPSADEQRLLGAFRYANNRAVLHTDARQMPKRRRVWTSWNYLSSARDTTQNVAVTYWMNKLQPLPTEQEYFVTLNALSEIDPASIIETVDYTHPMFDVAAMTAQRELWHLQGVGNTWFAGSYFGYGFHEDGLQSGLAAAEALGDVARPWTVDNASSRVLALGYHEQFAFKRSGQVAA